MRREKPPVSLEEILMRVTFNRGCGSEEMRQRIRARLEEEARNNPGDAHWREQLALFETARIGTLHSFCLQLVRQHFYVLGLDPQVSVLPKEEARLLAQETLDEMLQGHYAGQTPNAREVQELIRMHGRGWDKPIRTLLLRLHRYMREPCRTRRVGLEERGVQGGKSLDQWVQWLGKGFGEWRRDWMGALEGIAGGGNGVAKECLSVLAVGQEGGSRGEMSAVLRRIRKRERRVHGASKQSGWGR